MKIIKIAKKAFRYDCEKIDDINKNDEIDESKCDFPIIEYSVENITKSIIKKAEKHQNKDIDLFVFVTEDEYNLLIESLEYKNISYTNFKKALKLSPFHYVFIFKYNNYETETEKQYKDYDKILKINKNMRFEFI